MSDPVGTEGRTRIIFDNGLGNKKAAVSASEPLPVDIGGSTPGNPSGGVLTTQKPEDGSTLTKLSITMSGASAPLLAANSNRLIVIVCNAVGNSDAAIDITGGAAALDAGIPLGPRGTVTITGKAAQSAMTQIGTSGDKLTVYTG